MKEETAIIPGLCPDLEIMKEYLKIKNKYSDIERTSFSLEIMKCNNITNNGTCKPDSQIEDLFKGLYFNVYTISQEVELGNPSNYG